MWECLNVFRSDGTVVDTFVDKLIRCIGAEIRDLDLVIELVVEIVVFSHLRGEGICGNAREIGNNLDQREYLICLIRSVSPDSVRVEKLRNIPVFSIGAPVSSGSLETSISSVMSEGGPKAWGSAL